MSTTHAPHPAPSWHQTDDLRWYTRFTRGWVARTVVDLVQRRVPVAVRHPSGRLVTYAGPHAPTVEVLDHHAWLRLESHPKIGLGEAYQAGEWRAAPGHDLAAVLLPFAERMTTAIPRPLLACKKLVERALPAAHQGTVDGARSNVSAHYDLSNEMFAEFLDSTMTYSSALFDNARPWSQQTLEEAQRRKIDAVLDAAEVGDGTKLLEIGTGWGELAVQAARRGAHVTSITLSAEQLVAAQAKVDSAGLADQVTVMLCDYREVTGRFDAVVSVEMIEAVGEEYWPEYFSAISRALNPGGMVAVQAIVLPHDRYLATRRSYGWIQKHIFPGGLLPSTRALKAVAAAHTTLVPTESRYFGQHYATTLHRWRERFIERWPHIQTLGFDERFRRTWEFYLAYCEAGFASGYLDVGILGWRQANAAR